MDRAKLDAIIALVSRILNPAGFDCIEAEWSSGDKILRLFVDLLEPKAPDASGITLDGCVKASRLLEDVPELDQVIAGRFVLEVSSPGVERPLRLKRHFERHIGETIQVRLRDKFRDRRQGVGRLVEVAGDEARHDTLITLETEQGAWSFPLESLQRASLVYDWSDV